MDDHIKKATAIKALDDAKAYTKQLMEMKEKELWKKISMPCNLLDLLNGLLKNELEKIRQAYKLEGLSGYKKGELALELARQIPVCFIYFLHSLDQNRYDLIQAIVKNNGFIENPQLSFEQIDFLLYHGIVFPVIYDDKKMLCIPPELVELFINQDGYELKSMVKRNTEWIKLTHGMIYFYGVVSIKLAVKKIRELTGKDVDYVEFYQVMSSACDYYGQADKIPEGFKNDSVFEYEKILGEHNRRPEVGYYPFTKTQLLKAGEPDYVDMTPAMRKFVFFLSNHYELNDEDTKEISMQLIYMINYGSNPMVLIEYLQSWFDIFSLEFLREVAEKLMDVHNGTRQWVLKGYAPDELFKDEKKLLKPLSKEPFQFDPKPKLAGSQTKSKTGRNDYCPCGSGKKYKHCCGK